MLEYFVHLEKDDPPTDFVLAIAEIAEPSRRNVKVCELPANWRDAAAPPSLTCFGDEFAAARSHLLLFVPSVLAPSENNCLINPAHPEHAKIKPLELEPLRYDPRMFREERRRHRHR